MMIMMTIAGYCLLGALVILVGSVPFAVFFLWRATNFRRAGLTRTAALTRTRWIGGRSAVFDLYRPEGHGDLKRSIAFQRLSVVGLGLMIIGVGLSAIAGSR